MIKRILAVSALGTVGLLGLSALPAGAAAGPNVNLKDKAGVLKFKPGTLNLKEGKGKTCKSTNYTFSITNKSGATQEIDYDGSPFYSSAPGQVKPICIISMGTSTYSVEGTNTTLTVHMAK